MARFKMALVEYGQNKMKERIVLTLGDQELWIGVESACLS
jgi:hypothetical protein